MISVGVKELKARLSSYVDKVKHGEEVVITEHGKEVARVVPVTKERKTVKVLLESGSAEWAGGKPEGLEGIKIKGKPLSKTVLEERR